MCVRYEEIMANCHSGASCSQVTENILEKRIIFLQQFKQKILVFGFFKESEENDSFVKRLYLMTKVVTIRRIQCGLKEN
jgi:hypothetical protein